MNNNDNNKKIYLPELLAPVGDFECLKAAIQNGADAVYLGASSFNARYSATNFDLKSLEEAILYARLRNVDVHLVLNILIKNNEFLDALELAKVAYELGVSAIIVQDLGIAKVLIDSFPELPIHASTQLTVHNLEGARKLSEMGFKRIVLSRELSYKEICYITENISNVEIETFIHGALCVSYSGQCLFSSMIGARSGNRGKCAGPCRLPYSLLNSHNDILDKGYILSPKDLYGLEYLPKLMNAKVKCFKIEGRMKTPEYVATVTRIYRKYIDLSIDLLRKYNVEDLFKTNNIDEFLKEFYLIDEKDKKDLLQVFNRGGFSRGYLDEEPNCNIIYKEKPNNMGIFIGTISKFNTNRGYIDLEIEHEISLGDRIAIDTKEGSNNYTISELMINNCNIATAFKGQRATIGRMKGDLFVGNKIYRIENKVLNNLSTKSYKDVENKRIAINATITIKVNEPIKVIATDMNLETSFVTDIIPEKAIKAPISKERILEQFRKTKNSIYDFNNLNIELDDNVFLTISMVNELKRLTIESIDNLRIKNIRKSKNIDFSQLKLSKGLNLRTPNNLPKVSVLLNILNLNYDYSVLERVDRLYIPFKYFINSEYEKIIDMCGKKYNLYLYMPTIIKKNYINQIKKNLETIIKKYKIKGAVISNLAELEFFKTYNIELIANYTLNVFNNIAIDELKNLNLSTFSISPELDKKAILQLNNNSELIIYGKTPVMNSNYCVLGKSNKCYVGCKKYCGAKEKYYLQDRLGLKFRVIPDNIDTISTIYNSKITSISWKEILPKNIRIDILDENIVEINSIIKKAILDERFEGKEYTNGNLNREI